MKLRFRNTHSDPVDHSAVLHPAIACASRDHKSSSHQRMTPISRGSPSTIAVQIVRTFPEVVAITENPIRQITDAKLVDGCVVEIVTFGGICDCHSSVAAVKHS